MSYGPAKCATPGCPNTSYRQHCPSCLAEEANQRLVNAAAGECIHGHSVTGDYDMIVRLLPAYSGGPPEPGFLLDVCKTCLKVLQERPCNPVRSTRRQ
ncbi:MAG: hypothetical protein M3014_08075 [Chloroflexota bacterium]|nr:hypothetical protein [Chloroflexota bacterium]